MNTYSLVHLPDHSVMQGLAAAVARDRATTAELLAYLAEVDARRLYLRSAYPSMFAYCVGELRLSEEVAYKRIQAARAAREFPAIFHAVAEGRLHVSAVVLLGPHLTAETAGELLDAATHKTKAEIERLIAHRFPRPELPTQVRVIPTPAPPAATPQLDPDPVVPSATGRVSLPASRPKVTPVAPQRFALQLTMSQSTHDKLRRAQELLGHQIPSGDMAEVFDRALDALIEQLEKRKLAATSRPRQSQRRSSANPRYIPASVKRAVWERDAGRCTFMSGAGRRCEARARLEFDHVLEVARGGLATVENIRLRCRAHNQYTAERAFGAAFMRHMIAASP